MLALAILTWAVVVALIAIFIGLAKLPGMGYGFRTRRRGWRPRPPPRCGVAQGQRCSAREAARALRRGPGGASA